MSYRIVNGTFGGIDEHAIISEAPKNASEILNLRVKNGYALSKRPSKILLADSGMHTIESLWCGYYKGQKLILATYGGGLYRYTDRFVKLGDVGYGKCIFFEFGGYLYIKSPSFYGKYDGEALQPVTGYVPIVAISCLPDGSGTLYEQINRLSNERRQRFSCDGSSIIYKLAEDNITSLISVTINGEPCSINHSAELPTGHISFEAPPPAGLNNMEVTYSKGTMDNGTILDCTHLMQFGGNSDGRIFLWGNDNYPNYRFYSELADGVPSAEYFPVNNYTVIGNTAITCIVQQYNRQLIFTKDQAYYSYCELREDQLGNYYSSFPVYNLNSEKGCLIYSGGCVIDNKPVTVCPDGINVWESTNVENECNARVISTPIESLIRGVLPSPLNDSAIMFDHRTMHEFYYIVGDTAFVYNYNNNSWYTFDGLNCSLAAACDTSIYLATGNRLYRLDEGITTNETGECSWTSNFIDPGNGIGRTDLYEVVLDGEIYGTVELTVSCIDGYGNETVLAKYDYMESGPISRKITVRAPVRRISPFKIKFMTLGQGNIVMKKFYIKTRTKERGSRYGIHSNGSIS